MTMPSFVSTFRFQIDEVFRYFNVRQEEHHFFSRCSACNGDKYVIIPAESLRQLRDRQQQLHTSKVNYVADYEDADEDNDDDFGEEAFEAPGAVAEPTWWRFEGGDVNRFSGVVRETGVALKLADVPDGVVARWAEFNSCVTCGKVYWHGLHWKKQLANKNSA